MHKHHTVELTGKNKQTDWAGADVVRLDFKDNTHVYVPAGHRLARLEVGAKVEIKADC